MTDFVIWFGFVVLFQLSLLSLWFDSSLFKPLFNWVLSKYKETGYRWYIVTLLTCPMCLGYWLAWLSEAVFCLLPGSPLTLTPSGAVLFIAVGMAAAFASRVIDAYMPEPVFQKLIVYPIQEEEPKVEEAKEEEA